MKPLHIIALLCCVALALASCSETKNLAEDEQLYVGIKQVAYDKYLPRDKRYKGEGVITAVANAYEAVSALFDGTGQTADEAKPKAEKEETKADRRDTQAYADAKAEAEAALAKKPNNSLLGSTSMRFPLPIGLWIYNKYVYREGRWARWMMNTFAATPVYVRSVNPRVRAEVARNSLRNYGYFRATTDYRIVPTKSQRKARISYELHPGELFHLGNVSYSHFPAVADSLVSQSLGESLLTEGAPFSVANLTAEQTRIATLLRNNGFYYYQPSYITYKADTIMRAEQVQLEVRPKNDVPAKANKQYYIGQTRINIYNYEDRQLTDSFSLRNGLTFAFTGKKHGKTPLKLRTMLPYLAHRPGNLYSLEAAQKLQKDFGNMGIFSVLAVQYAERDDTLDVTIDARLDKPYDAEVKANVANKSNGLLGPGASFSMSRANAFGGAERVSLDLKGSYEWMTGADVQADGSAINSYELGAELNLQFPRLTLMTLGKPLNRRAKTQTTYKLEANLQNRSGYFGQVTVGGRIMYSYQRKERFRHELIPFRLEYNMLTRTTERFDSIIAVNQALYYSLRDQFVLSMQYTLQMPDFTLRTKLAHQFVKLTAEVVKSISVTRKSQLVGRLFGGVVRTYDPLKTAPYGDLFVIGGANSLRAFTVRSIGPGAYSPAASSYSYIDQMGDLKLEANLEYRFPIVSSLYGALFVDAGNVWLLNADADRPGGNIQWSRLGKDIALGTGLGVRYDLDFLVLRFDVGVGLHAPYDTGYSGYYNMPRFGKTLGYHIAVGYPF